jgi:hypothetical protein
MRPVPFVWLLIGIVATVILTPVPPAGAFLAGNILELNASTFDFSLSRDPQWRLTTSGGDVYRGATLDSARFEGEFGLSFGDETLITLNDVAIQAKLKGRIDENCNEGRVTLKDVTNRRTITIVFGGPGSSLISCTPL